MRLRWAVAAFAVACALTVSAGAQTTFNLTMTGFFEPDAAGNLGAGDVDGSAIGTLTLDPTADTVNWNLNYQNISGDAISGFHIHGPGATLTNTRPVFIGFPLSSTTVPNGTQTGTLTTASLADLGTRIDQVLANPSEFYINLHSSGTGGFPGGAVRSPLPEPGALGLLGLAALPLLRRRRA
jgi:hypothetical protein